MKRSIIYLAVREEIPLEGNGFTTFPEKAFKHQGKANIYCLEQDPTRRGFVYNCPCGCGESHYRSWSLMTIVLEE